MSAEGDSKHISLGKKGEDIASKYLMDQGYIIIERNWRHEKLEVDIIARKENTICLVEVKTRSGNEIEAEDVMNFKKEENLISAADAYMNLIEEDLECRVDLITVEKKNGDFNVTHIEDAIKPES